jgi:hypothetical protein
MPTAIIAFHTQTGFVIAADGRGCSPDLSIKSDTAQKIFPLKSDVYDLAFAVMGRAEIVAQNMGEEKLNLIDEIHRLVALQNPLHSKGLAGFMTRICRSINQTLARMKERGTISAYPGDPAEPDLPGLTLSTIFVCGYFRGYPELLEVRLYHTNQALCDPHIKNPDEVIRGSRIVGKLIESEDPRFAKYYAPLSADPTALEVIEYSKKYIEAHADPAAIEIDPTVCSAIGGHIHIATITRSDGFRWVQGFQPVSDQPPTHA